MKSWADEQLDVLRPNYPGWDIWIVPNYGRGETWCARPTGHPVATINADSPEELVEEIRRQEQVGL